MEITDTQIVISRAEVPTTIPPKGDRDRSRLPYWSESSARSVEKHLAEAAALLFELRATEAAEEHARAVKYEAETRYLAERLKSSLTKQQRKTMELTGGDEFFLQLAQSMRLEQGGVSVYVRMPEPE